MPADAKVYVVMVNGMPMDVCSTMELARVQQFSHKVQLRYV